MSKLIPLIGLFLFVSCGTMRLQVKSSFKSAQKSGLVIYERTYPVSGGLPLWCGLTAVFYGGACWAYLIVPFVPDELKAIRDTESALNAQLGSSDAVLEKPQVKRISWSSAEPFLSVE